jgi:aminodeoxyfutalosine deaminase
VPARDASSPPAAEGRRGGLSPAALRSLPKVELHVHLEGSISPEQATALARAHGEDPDEVLELEDGRYPPRFAGFDHFLATFLATTRQVRDPDDLARVAATFAHGQARQGAVWTETTFTALTLVEAGMEPAAMWAALRDGFADADAEVGLIVDTVRDLGPEAAHRTIALVEEADAPIVGLGLTGLEGSSPESGFAPLRDAADRLGLGFSVHAGETGTAANVRAAVDELGADRIGHGLAVLEDPDLTSRLARAGTVFEVCPSSNVALGIVPSLEEHPLPRMASSGLAVTISSDDPPLFATSLSQEVAHAARLLGLDVDGVADLQARAARASFAPAPVRERALEAVERWRSDHA